MRACTNTSRARGDVRPAPVPTPPRPRSFPHPPPRRASDATRGGPRAAAGGGTCAVFTGAGARPCDASEPVGWAVLRLLGLRPAWCWHPQDLAFPVVVRGDDVRAGPDLADHAWWRSCATAPTAACAASAATAAAAAWFDLVAPGSGVRAAWGASSPSRPRRSRSTSPRAAAAAPERHAAVRALGRAPVARRACDRHGDVGLCAAARRAGADSVLIERVNYGADAVAWRGRRQGSSCARSRAPAEPCSACPAAVDLRRRDGARHVCGDGWRLPPVAPEAAARRGLACDRTACAWGVLGSAAALAAAALAALAARARGARALRGGARAANSATARRRARRARRRGGAGARRSRWARWRSRPGGAARSSACARREGGGRRSRAPRGPWGCAPRARVRGRRGPRVGDRSKK